MERVNINKTEMGRAAWPAELYDEFFLENKDRRGPPEKSWYYKLWMYIIENHLDPSWRILDVGCGSGQFIKLCVERGYKCVGVDFSVEALKIAKRNAPEVAFHLVDVSKNQSIIKEGNYDVITFIEVLEHVENDLEILQAVPMGKNMVLSVPNQIGEPGGSHVRGFETILKAANRYGSSFRIIKKPYSMKFPPKYAFQILGGIR